MRRFPKANPELVQVALDTYNAEKLLDPSAEAMETAIKAVILRVEQQTQSRIAKNAKALANRIEAEAKPSFEGAAALRLFSDELQKELPVLDQPYEPTTNDLVELRIVGYVTVYEAECPACGEDLEPTSYGIFDESTQSEFFIEPESMEKASIRVISRADRELV